ncbi:EAL domain-containing protein [Catenovulum maritimum]|uniref:Diguanylate cyclase n=1 Tax=Catenovulum maritimum TaxID=1513271 RepID=A0A0J8GM71_9ALTE|nr:EAL domain-containing protein [Catenovulum maritimum]KMT63932.1 hypothetical protein XM47_17035 [Catenovulum maritimum]
MINARHSLKFSIIRWLSAVFVLAFVAIGTILFLVEKDLAKDKVVTDLNVIAEILGNRSIAALIFNDVSAANTNLSAAQYHQTIDQICLYDQNGDFFALYVSANNKRVCTPKQDIYQENHYEFSADNVNLFVSISDNSQVIGALVIDSNLDFIKTSQQQVVGILTIVLVVAIIAIYMLTNGLLTRMLSPLHHLHETAKSITTNVFSDIRAYKSKDDEVGQLVDVFNSMLDSLAKEHNLLQISEKRFRALADHAPIGIYLRDSDDRFVYVNQKWQDMTQCKLPLSFIDYRRQINAEDWVQVSDQLAQANLVSDSAMIEYGFTTAKGTSKAFLEQIAPVDVGDDSLSACIGSLLDVTELKQAQDDLERMAFNDPLTGLANRRFFNDHLKIEIVTAHKMNQSLAVLMLDLDHFKRVNDTQGHECGDELLTVVARKISQSVSTDDVVSRMGGDEFMILIRDIQSPAQLDRLVQNILASVVTPMGVDSLLDVTASIGVSVYPRDGETGAELIRNADIALYKAKDSGRNQAVYFSKVLDTEIKQKVRLEHKLKHALSENELSVYLQPQYNATAKKFFWAEALIRWIDKEDGFIPPDKFIGLAEETGLIHEIGLFVLREVCAFISKNEAYLTDLGIEGVAVNLSARQFFAKGFLDEIKQVLVEFSVRPEQLEFELTESMVMENTQHAIEIMHQLRDLGIRLSIDDFGTGYSSLAYLKRFPIHSVKIDRSFIRDIPDDQHDVEIASAIIAMAQKLGLEIIAEGVETQLQSDFLHEQGCSFMQGYFYAKPMPFQNVLELSHSESEQKSEA